MVLISSISLSNEKLIWILVLDSYSEIPTFSVDVETTSPITDEIVDFPGITQTLIHGNGKKVKEDTLIGSFDKWWPTFEIRFEVKIDSFGSTSGFLLLFTSKDGNYQTDRSSGQFIPAIFSSN